MRLGLGMVVALVSPATVRDASRRHAQSFRASWIYIVFENSSTQQQFQRPFLVVFEQ